MSQPGQIAFGRVEPINFNPSPSPPLRHECILSAFSLVSCTPPVRVAVNEVDQIGFPECLSPGRGGAVAPTNYFVPNQCANSNSADTTHYHSHVYGVRKRRHLPHDEPQGGQARQLRQHLQANQQVGQKKKC